MSMSGAETLNQNLSMLCQPSSLLRTIFDKVKDSTKLITFKTRCQHLKIALCFKQITVECGGHPFDRDMVSLEMFV